MAGPVLGGWWLPDYDLSVPVTDPAGDGLHPVAAEVAYSRLMNSRSCQLNHGSCSRRRNSHLCRTEPPLARSLSARTCRVECAALRAMHQRATRLWSRSRGSRCERVPPSRSYAEASISFVISNAVGGTWLGAGTHPRVVLPAY